MSDFLTGVLVAVVIVAALAVLAYVLLRRWFERASRRAADQMGEILSELSGRAAGTPLGHAAGRATQAAASGFTHFGAYAASRGMSEADARREFTESIERIAKLMDSAVRIPIIGPVGLDALLGLFPVAGDATSAAVSVMLIARSIKYGVPRELIARMLANVLFDLAIGSIPIAGDLADLWFRANLRNVELLREYLKADASDTIEIKATRVS